MVHFWQEVHGKAPRRSYHDRGREDEGRLLAAIRHRSARRRRLGRRFRIPHAGGPFAQAFAKLEASGFKLRCRSIADDPPRAKKAANKTKYTCPSCGPERLGEARNLADVAGSAKTMAKAKSASWSSGVTQSFLVMQPVPWHDRSLSRSPRNN